MIFDFQCHTCKRIDTDVYLRLHHKESELPVCCEYPMSKAHFQAPAVHWRDYQLPDGGFKVGKEGTVITSRKERREYMKANDLIDSNDLYAPPTKAEERIGNEERAESINAITPTERQATELKKAGILDAI